MAKPYNPLNWYWIVNGDESKTYSSVIGDYVPSNNSTYTLWLADGTTPTRIANEAELGEVLSNSYPQITRPVPAGVLDGYQSGQSDDLFKRALSKLLFQMVNDIRALKGQAPVNAQQARNYVKGLM